MKQFLVTTVCLLASNLAMADSPAPPPSTDLVEQAIGFYAKGSLVDASELTAPDGDGWLKIVRGRGRRYGSRDLLDLLTSSASEIHKAFPAGERLQIADVAQEQGGYISGHSSHQNGLDADIIYFRMNHQEQDPNDDSGLHEIFVENGKISPNFDLERNWRIIQKLVAGKQVNRIFMDPVIKQALCDYAKSINEFSEDSEPLRRMRPFPNHQNHMHVRINCPDNSPKCTLQADPPAGAGCSSVNESYVDALLREPVELE